ncbi:MAG: type II toxin-antitoxin system VapC family toxin [Candidatus Micrarchaeota archaeon]|nr:type II toxin-antitoxin system VapC family toxin [Candidatus Micrarchaeota archaeon]
MACLDTNVILNYIHGNETVRKLVDAYAEAEAITTTSVTRFEILCAPDQAERQLGIEFLNQIKVYDFDRKSAEIAAHRYRKLKSAGTLIGDTDIMIASIAGANDETLITQDSDFERIKSGRIVIIKEKITKA